MAEADSIGTRLRRLKNRSRLSLQDIANAIDSKRATVQRYFEPEYRERGVLDVELALKLVAVFEGKGDPPISRNEVLELTGLPRVAEEQATGYSQLSYEVAEVMAEATARIAVGGKEPPADAVEAIAKMLTSLSALYERDPAARHDPGQTRGALKILAQQFAPPGRR